MTFIGLRRPMISDLELLEKEGCNFGIQLIHLKSCSNMAFLGTSHKLDSTAQALTRMVPVIQEDTMVSFIAGTRKENLHSL